MWSLIYTLHVGVMSQPEVPTIPIKAHQPPWLRTSRTFSTATCSNIFRRISSSSSPVLHSVSTSLVRRTPGGAPITGLSLSHAAMLIIVNNSSRKWRFHKQPFWKMADLWDQIQVRCPVSISRVLAQEDGWKLFPDIENWSPVSVERRFSIKVEQRDETALGPR